jgi:hypothetical protein
MQHFLLATFVGIGLYVSAQRPAIHSHTILPANPTINSHIKIVTHLETLNSAFLVDQQFTVTASAKDIKLHLCYADGFATVISHHIDTFAVGQLPQGIYSLQLSAYMSDAGQHCSRVDSNFTTSTFTVSGPVGVDENETINKIKIFPNPAHDHITIDPKEVTTMRIFSLQGQLLRESAISYSGTITLHELPPGIYLVELISPAEKKLHRIIKQ